MSEPNKIDMQFKGVDRSIAAFIHYYRVENGCTNLTDTLETIIKELKALKGQDSAKTEPINPDESRRDETRA